jgi:putative transposase
MIVGVVVHGANIQDRDGARRLIQKIRLDCPRMKKLWADGGYAGELEDWVRDFTGWELEIVRRAAAAKGFKVLPKRWIVERTFGWLNRYRRLSKDYEYFAQTAENIIHLAMINLMLHRLAPEAKNYNYLPRKQAAAA